jgi:alpha-glucosidase
MNEPAVFNDEKTFPRDVRHDYDGHPCSHRRGHNIYGMQMVRATHEGLRRHLGGKRPFVITRSAYAGTWRYSSAWTGDNVSSWEHLKLASVQCSRLSLSGYSFVGSDIGGFLEKPEGELFTRWIQLGIFHPFCRTHSSGDQGDQEPWSFGEPYTSVVRDFLKFRYQLLPYLYTAFWQHVQTGDPILRPMVYFDGTDPEALGREEEFGVGENLLVCPVSKKGADGRWLYLPEGGWFDYWTDEFHSEHGEVWADAPLERVPLYVRAGAVLPLAKPVQFTAERDWSELDLDVYNLEVGEHDSALYEDAGEGEAYRDGECKVRRFEVSQIGGLRIKQKVEGEFEGAQRFRIVIHGFGDTVGEAFLDGGKVEPVLEDGRLVFEDVPSEFHELVVHAH